MTNTEITSEEIYEDIQNKVPLLILDLRSPENYMAGHIEGSANAKCVNMQQKQAVISRLPRDQKIILIDDDGNEASQNSNMLVRFGFDAHYLKNGIKSWDKTLVKSKQDTVISNEKLWEFLKSDKEIFLLDVREPIEFAEFKIPGAI